MEHKKIKVIDIEEPSREDIVRIIENYQPDEPPQVEAVEEQPAILPSEPVVMKKPRAARAPRAKKETEPIQEETIAEVIPDPPKEEPTEEPKEIPEEENQTVKTVKLVECPKCNKKLTARTLKYSHDSVCPANGNKPPTQVNKPKQAEQLKEDIPPMQLPPQLTAYDKKNKFN